MTSTRSSWRVVAYPIPAGICAPSRPSRAGRMRRACDFAVHRHDAPLEARRQLLAEPRVEPAAPAARSQPFDPEGISARLITLRKMRSSSTSSSQRTIPASGRGLIHSETISVSISQPRFTNRPRALPLARVPSRSEPRSGEAAKNSARVPLRPVLRAHSSIETTTTAGRPFLVIACGPSLSARSMDFTQPSLGARYRPSRFLGYASLAGF